MAAAGRLLFIAAVTSVLLARVVAGAGSHPELLIYAGTAAFGLEFLLSSWRDLWKPS